MIETYTPDEVAKMIISIDPTFHLPSDEQRPIISIFDNPLEPAVVIAGAGSGKTETMAARVVYLVANGFASLVDKEVMKNNLKEYEETKLQGIHIHCPEGAVPKDGPSAGTAITCAIYSILTNQPIKKTIAITGEINLQGCVTAIGGLDLKILGGIKGGVKEFIFPKENLKDFHDFQTKYSNKNLIDDIKFHPVENIQQVLKLIFEA